MEDLSMFRWITPPAIAAVVLVGLIGCNGNAPESSNKTGSPDGKAAPVNVGKPLYAQADTPKTASPAEPAPRNQAADPVVIHDCRLTVFDKRDFASQREGILQFIGTEIKPGEKVPDDDIIMVPEGGVKKPYRKLKENDVVADEQLLGRLDDRLARDEFASKKEKVEMAQVDAVTAEKTKEEAYWRWQTNVKLGPRGAAQEETNERKLAYEKFSNDTISKRKAVDVAKLEANQAETVLKLHEIRSTIPGVVKTIYKRSGESIKNLDPVIQIFNLGTLRAEGLVDIQYLPRLREGMTAIVEPSIVQAPDLTLPGHLQSVTAVAVSKDPKHSLIASASEDGTVRVWDRKTGEERRLLRHPGPVRAVACTGLGAAANLCLTGCADGKARLYDLDADGTTPLRELRGEHRGAITCVAFSPDGRWCATGGNDSEIYVWDTATGQRRYRLSAAAQQPAHRAPVTWLQFGARSELVSAGKDNTVRVWLLGQEGARLENSFGPRLGYVETLGVSPDGQRFLLDQGRSLRLLTLPEGKASGALQNPSAAANFTTFAQFAPDGRSILTASASQAVVQLWRAPGPGIRSRELRQYLTDDHAPATCAAFAPDGSFFVTGTTSRQVVIWPMPSREETEKQYTARITLIDPTVEANGRQVRIWADLPNPGLLFRPGTSVTLVVYPQAK
jgi:WD40 repeat protein